MMCCNHPVQKEKEKEGAYAFSSGNQGLVPLGVRAVSTKVAQPSIQSVSAIAVTPGNGSFLKS
jgi:hypothetical protein